MQSGLAMMLAFGCVKHATAPPEPSLAFDVSAIDRTADPCADFYAYACGGWMARSPIPEGKARWSRMSELEALNARRMHELVEGARGAGPDASEAERRVGTFYDTCLDEARIDARRLEPVQELLASIAAIHDAESAADVIADLNAHGTSGVIYVLTSWDPSDPLRVIPAIAVGPLGFLRGENYTGQDQPSRALRDAYLAHLTRLFQLLGDDAGRAAAAAQRTFAFEAALSRKHAVGAKPETLPDFENRYPSIPWRRIFHRLGAPVDRRVRVEDLGPLDALHEAFSGGNFDDLADMLRKQLATAMSFELPTAVDREVRDFYDRILYQRPNAAPRAADCRELLDHYLGHDVSRLYSERYHGTVAGERAASVIERLVTADRRAIAATEWLGSAARNEAQIKLSRMKVVVGARDPLTGPPPDIVTGDAFGNAWRVREFYAREEMARTTAPAAGGRFPNWLAHELHLFEDVAPHVLVLSAGILQPPVFDARMDDAVNYGALGSLVGHELVHHRDKLGQQVDSDDYFRSWWSSEELARYQKRESCFAAQYQDFGADGQKRGQARGAVTHNIADNAGLRLAYDALAPSAADATIDGYTSSQRFFLSWGQINCENATPEGERGHLQRTLEASGRWRVNGSVMNMPEFAEAFSCSIGEPMAPPERCAI